MTNPMVYACLMGGLRQTPHHTGELSWCGLVNLLNMRLHVRAAIPRSLANATQSIRPAALFARAVGTTLSPPACSPGGDSMHTHLIPNTRIYFNGGGLSAGSGGEPRYAGRVRQRNKAL